MTRYHWNYRVIRHVEFDGEEYFAVHEVHYDDDVPTSVTVNPVGAGATELDGLRRTLERMTAALDKPVLDYVSFGKPVPAGDPPGPA
jgi:hypothetical protein